MAGCAVGMELIQCAGAKGPGRTWFSPPAVFTVAGNTDAVFGSGQRFLKEWRPSGLPISAGYQLLLYRFYLGLPEASCIL